MQLIDKYLNYVEPIKGSVMYHRWSFITIVAALLERRVWLDRGRLGVIFPNMYTILVGPPAAGKSTAAQLTVDLFNKIEIPGKPKPRLGPTKITQAALYKELKDSEKLYPVPGVGDLRSSPLFVYASELAINMVDFGGGTLTNELIDFYDSKGLYVEIQKRIVTDNKTLILANPSLTLLGGTTESFLQSAAQDKLITSGLSSRILFVVEPNRVLKQRSLVNQDLGSYQELIEALRSVYALLGPIVFDREAEMRYIELAEKADNDCFDAIGEFYQNYYGRKPDHITKVAITLAAMRGSKIISISDIEQALQWIEEVEPYMISAFGTRNIEKDDDLHSQLAELIPLAPDTISESGLRRLLLQHGKFISVSETVTGVVEGLKRSSSIRETIIGSERHFSRLSHDPA